MTNDHLDHYREYGYAIVKGVFTPDEVEALAHAPTVSTPRASNHGRAFRNGNTFCNVTSDAALGPVMRMMQWPAYIDPVLDRVRTDRRMFDIVSPLIGGDLKQIINQMHWKSPGASMVEFGYHQDIRSRRPRTAYRDPAGSYTRPPSPSIRTGTTTAQSRSTPAATISAKRRCRPAPRSRTPICERAMSPNSV